MKIRQKRLGGVSRGGEKEKDEDEDEVGSGLPE
jgi:hypothetical protein